MSSHGGHTEWCPPKPTQIFKEDYHSKIPPKFGWNQTSSFRGVDENVKSLRRRRQRRTQCDEKSSHGL